MERLHLECEPDDGQLVVRLRRKGFLGRLTTVPYGDWPAESNERLAAAVAVLDVLLDEGGATLADDGIRLTNSAVACMNANHASLLGIPPDVPFTLEINHRGTIDQFGFHVDVGFLGAALQPVHGAVRIGSLLKFAGQSYRIPHQLYRILEASDDLNEAGDDAESRFRAWAEIQFFALGDAAAVTRPDPYVRNIRVLRAGAFALDVRAGADGFEFDPVLYPPSVLPADAETAVQRVWTAADALLSHDLQEIFAHRRFRALPDCRTRYPLDRGWYVTIDPNLRKALVIVRELQDADAGTRRQFVRNPRAVLRDRLEGILTESELEAVFVETEEFGTIIQDIGVWTPSRLLPAERIGEQWLPDVPGTSAATASDARNLAVEDTAAPPVLVINPAQVSERFHPVLRPRSDGGAPAIPSGLRTVLKPHQAEGIAWLQEAWRKGEPGALLADDMGLGKTLQALSFLVWVHEVRRQSSHARYPALICAPVGLLINWKTELERHFAGGVLGDVEMLFGARVRELRRTRGKELGAGVAGLDTSPLKRAGVVLTTYETIRDCQHSLGAVRFDGVVFDEAQKIKTPGALVTHAAKSLNSDFVLTMTGTPIENRLADLWCIVDTASPGRLGDVGSFTQKYESNPDPEDLRHLKASLTDTTDDRPPLMLRRLKADRLEGLPAKTEHVHACEMPDLQATAYTQAVLRARSAQGPGRMLSALHELRMISLHPHGPAAPGGREFAECSARLKKALEVMDAVAEQHEKILVFLESLEMQPVLAGVIQQRYRLRRTPMLINGSVHGVERQRRVDEFQASGNGFDAIILSPRAGGVGITLTEANHVIHLTRWWNPAVEDQCTDRVHRIGQQRPVQVHIVQAVHPVFGEASFDVTLHRLLTKKRALSREMLMPTTETDDDVRDLYSQTIASG